jgi:hypothetical protein
MMVTEVVGELACLIGALADRPGSERLENLQLVPQVLDLFAPLVKSFRRGIGPRCGENLRTLRALILIKGSKIAV